MNNLTFIALTEKDKRVILILFLLIIVIIALVAVIGALIVRIMKWQGKRMDNLTHDVVVTKVIDNKKGFRRYANKKNMRLFFTQSYIPIIIMLVSSLVLILHNVFTNDWGYNLLDYEKTGFNTLFFVFDFSDPNIYHNFFGLNLLCDWPPVINYPHFTIEAWASYIFFFGMLIGSVWYLIAVQCFISRTIQMFRLSYNIYNKSLDGYNINNDNTAN